ncbi:DNA recombination protein RmuC [Brachybacterium sp. EF45031]|nr:DNA recombination protein RmuC [Brachybacterium sillae]
MLLLGLVLGALIGAVITWLAMREVLHRREQARDAHTGAFDQLLLLADERFARDAARRDAVEEERQAHLQRTLAPITASLTHLERSLARSEAARIDAEGALREHLGQLAERARSLESGTASLTAALRAPTARGRWGEVQLRRIVEAAGMLDHVDFDEQHAGVRADGERAQRPDLVVHLSGGRTLVVDAKAPMEAYLDAVEETDPARAASRRAAHAKALRHHVGVISSKAYWKALGDTPEFTVVFVPSDGVLAAALDADPALLEDAFGQDVVIASPATLMALLRTVAHTWRTEALNRDARAVLDAGRELHHRLGTFAGHLGKVGRSLDAAVGAYNDAVGSLQARVMVTARRFEDMGLVGTPVPEVDQLTRRSRTLDDAEVADLAAGRRAVSDRSGHDQARPSEQSA